MKQKGINMATVDFEHSVTDLINECALPASTIRLVLARLLNEVSRLEDELIARERAEYEKDDGSEDLDGD